MSIRTDPTWIPRRNRPTISIGKIAGKQSLLLTDPSSTTTLQVQTCGGWPGKARGYHPPLLWVRPLTLMTSSRISPRESIWKGHSAKKPHIIGMAEYLYVWKRHFPDERTVLIGLIPKSSKCRPSQFLICIPPSATTGGIRSFIVWCRLTNAIKDTSASSWLINCCSG